MPRSDAHITLGTKVGFLAGWMFFALAFLMAAAESTVGRGFITSTNDLLVAMMGGKWIALKARYASDFFDLIVLPVLQLPAWLLCGLPAGFLLWTCRPHREEIDPDLYESLTTYDRLAKLADEEGAADDDPTFSAYDLKDYDDTEIREDLQSPQTYMKNWHPHDAAEPENPDSHQEGMGNRVLSPQEKIKMARDGLSIPFDKLS